MIPGMVSLVLDVAIVGLLVATIVYAIRLNRQIATLKDARGELEGLVREFTEATGQADASVRGMRKAAAESGENLQHLIERAAKLKEEMEFIIQAADMMANRLETASTGTARQVAAAQQRQAAPAPAPR
ncbi:MAG TPA: DUF6468 domain-containing protein, partial [Azospirillaceae bacterium]|nr:DUF6468 domain-containing protein [Azospirillaceae bacterium]